MPKPNSPNDRHFGNQPPPLIQPPPTGSGNFDRAPPPLEDDNENKFNPMLPVLIGASIVMIVLLLMLFSIAFAPAPIAGLGESETESVVANVDSSLSDMPASTPGSELDGDENADTEADDDDKSTSDLDQAEETPDAEVTIAPVTSEFGSEVAAAEFANDASGDSDHPPEEGDLNTFAANELAEFEPSTSAGAKAIAPIGGTARFFGLESSGNHVAYVIDKSSSMAGPRLALAKQKLMESLKELKKGQKFSVYFFDDAPVYDQRFANCRVTDSNLRKVSRWLSGINGDWGTDPLPAMELAYRGGCDTIFLLSDGEFDDGQRITRMNTKKIPISTIGLGFDSQTLKDIAHQNNGKYRLVR